MDKNQLQIIEELVRTERNYVKDMQDVVQVRVFGSWTQKWEIGLKMLSET